MSDRTTLLALAERCEQADGPDRELDAEIFVSVTPKMFFKGHLVGLIGSGVMYEADTYTASLDAAVTLVPEGWRLSILSEWDNETLRNQGPWQCIIMPAGKGDDLGIGLKARSNHAATPALAICAAALRARAALGEKE